MAKFTVTKNIPTNPSKDEYLALYPDFISEIDEMWRFKPANGVTNRSFLESIMELIKDKYDPFRQVKYDRIPYGDYVGLTCAKNAQVACILLDIIEKYSPELITSYLDTIIKKRPLDTKVVYFNGNLSSSFVFSKNGLDYIEDKDIPEYLNSFSKKNKKNNTNPII